MPATLPPAERRISRRIAAISRIRHAGRRREGQGAQGRGQAGDRLRRGRARLPDARLHRRGRGRRLPRPAEPPVHPGRRAARAQGGDRREDARATPAAGRPPARCWSPTAASRPSTRRSPRCSTRATRCCCPAPYWTTYPEAIRLAGGVPVPVVADEHERLPGHGRASSRRRAPRAPRCCCSARRPTRPARSTRPSRSRRSAGGRWTHGLWVITDEIYEHLTYGGVDVRRRCRWSCPSWPTAASSSTASPRPTP